MKADRVLDARGWSCTWCCLKAISILRTLESGQVLKVLGTDPLALEDLPRILERTDNQLIGVEKQPDYFRLYLRRGPAAEGGCSGGK
ncbi:MAG: sulfurtransferase TusA family protein [Syntrophobacteria bacterium]